MKNLLDRFCRYVKVDTRAVDDVKEYPSCKGQLELAAMLARELQALGLGDASVDSNGIVTATVAPTAPSAPPIAWLAHMDTSPEASGTDVKPIVHRKYDGKDIVLPGDPTQVLRPAETPTLARLAGKTIITSDGTTLLGADDKAGIAIVMTAIEELLRAPDIRRGPIRILFTCDEEIGRGCDKLDVKKIDAAAAYTLDGEDEGWIEHETFSANLATVTITGANIHPGFAKGKMVNSVRLAGKFLDRMPWQALAPEATSGREGFLHPYVIEGGVAETKIKILLRSFVTSDLKEQQKILERIAANLTAEFPRAKVAVAVKKQYRNMIEHLGKEPRAVELATRAVRAAGLEPRFQSVRGGTDGSRLSEMGLPTPNLSVGMHNFHSKLEFACLEQMESAVKVLVELARLWGREKGASGATGRGAEKPRSRSGAAGKAVRGSKEKKAKKG
ncbi:MAG: peptidase T [Planctomycetes bacterium]|nr:peptidase T [Planctomycetota bacterium]